MLRALLGSGWKTSTKAANSCRSAWPSALASLAPSAVTAVEKAGSSPGRPGGHSAQTASSTRRAARPAILRQKVMGSVPTPVREHDMTIPEILQPDQAQLIYQANVSVAMHPKLGHGRWTAGAGSGLASAAPWNDC